MQFHCKAGSLHIDEVTVQVVKKEPIWQIAHSAIARIGMKRGLVMADIAFFTGDGTAYVAESIGKVDVDKLLTLFPGIEIIALTDVPKMELPAPTTPAAVICKTGRLHIDTNTVSVTNFKKPVWSVAYSDVTQVIQQKAGTLSIDLTFVATSGLYKAPEIAKYNVEKVLAYFPGLVCEMPSGDLWYLDPVRRTYLATYTSDADAQRDLEAAAQNGWMPQDTTGTAGHINVGRTAAKVAVLGPLALVTGASRSKDKLTITYVRTPEWLTTHSSQ